MLGLLTACYDQDPHDPQTSTSHDLVMRDQGEIFGNVWDAGGRTTDATYYVMIEARDDSTRNSLHPDYRVMRSWVDNTPGVAHQFEWYDATATDGPCEPYSNFFNGIVGSEVHRSGPGVDGSGPEKHCIVPGRYTFTLIRSTAVGDSIIRQFPIDHLQSEMNGLSKVLVRNDSAGGVLEWLAANDFSPDQPYKDLLIDIDRSSPGVTDAALLQVDNALTDRKKGTFVAQHGITGSDQDYYRVSVARSSSNWRRTGNDQALTRIFWDFDRNRGNSTGYYDALTTGGPAMRWHRYLGQIGAAGPVKIAMDYMRPDENPNDQAPQAVEVMSNITVTPAAPVACWQFENTNTWQYTDQIFDASCSTAGPNIRYSWLYNGYWTPESSGSQHSFLGHSAAGTQSLTLKVRNTTTNQSTTQSYPFNVTADSTVLSGPTFILTKSTYKYRSVNRKVFPWLESFDTVRTWWPALTPDSVLNRVWPAGKYAVELRHEDSASIVLKRGRLHVEVCTTGNCFEFASLASVQDNSGPTNNVLFGIGPVVSWNGGGVRFYDLFGSHDVVSPLNTPESLKSAGVETGGLEGAQISWSPLPHAYTDVDLAKVDLTLADSREATFGMAVDFDLGPDAADDQSGYDSSTGMAYVYDSGSAAGILLRRNRSNAITSVQQFGIRRLPPTSVAATQVAQRTQSVSLISGRSDVELIVSAPAVQESTSYTVMILRAGMVGELRTLAAKLTREF